MIDHHIAMTIGFMATNSVFIDWNAHLMFSGVDEGFESWARTYEDRAEENQVS